MSLPESAPKALEGLHILDLTDSLGQYCTKLLADLGADVIKVEPPQGCPTRRIGPFKDDKPGLERSLSFLHFNTNKRSITLNLEHEGGRGIFQRLLSGADALVESYPPGTLEGWGLGYEVLRGWNPSLILTSISPFGQSGPYRDFKAPDLVSFAMGGIMYISGDPAKPPTVAPCEQAHHTAGVHAALATLVALYNRRETGLGEWVEVSAHEAQAAEEHLIMRYSIGGEIVRRHGSQHSTAPTRIYPCRDGFVHIFVSRPEHWNAFLEVMGHPEPLTDPVWEDVRFRRENVDVLDPVITAFTLRHTREKLVALLQGAHIPCTPVNNPAEFAHDPHTQARGWVAEAEHPVTGRHAYPGAPYLFSETPWRIERSAPLLGQHNKEVYCGELGVSPQELARWCKAGIV